MCSGPSPGGGDYVGHRSPQSTEIYPRVPIAAMREVAMGDGEEL